MKTNIYDFLSGCFFLKFSFSAIYHIVVSNFLQIHVIDNNRFYHICQIQDEKRSFFSANMTKCLKFYRLQNKASDFSKMLNHQKLLHLILSGYI